MDKLGPNSANSSPLTPLGFLERTATVYGDRPSIVYNSTVYTWAQTHRRCLRLASALSAIGISVGDVVSVLAPNVPAMYEMHFGIPMSGAVLNAINLRLDARTVSILLCHGGSKLLFVDGPSRSLADDAIRMFPADRTPPRLVLIDDPFEPSVSTTISDGLTYEKLIEMGDPNFEWIRPRSEWSPMVLNYTSGTTSSPKGVVHCHRALFLGTVNTTVDWSLPKNPVYLWTLPMFHANGWSFPWGVAAVGGTNICLRRFVAATIYSAIHSHGVTHLCGAPVVLNMIANAPESVHKVVNDRKVRILTAGAPPPATVLYKAESLGFEISHGYGLTETAGVVVSCAWRGEWDRLPATERARMKARQGVRTLAMEEIDVVDGASGKSVARDGSTMGEIVLRGSCVMLGYLMDEAATRKAIRSEGCHMRKGRIPPSSFKLPLIGNLHQLVGPLPNWSLATLSRKHGHVMLLRLGCVPALVVSSPDATRDVMKAQDHVFADRPSLTVSGRLLYGCKDVAFAPNGEYWRRMRKLNIRPPAQPCHGAHLSPSLGGPSTGGAKATTISSTTTSMTTHLSPYRPRQHQREDENPHQESSLNIDMIQESSPVVENIYLDHKSQERSLDREWEICIV